MNALRPFSVPVALAGIPALGILFAYWYELGYASAFGIPIELVKVDNLDIVRIWIPMAGIAAIVGIGPMYLLFVPAEQADRAWRLLPVFVLAGFYTLFVTLFAPDSLAWSIGGGIVFLVVVVGALRGIPRPTNSGRRRDIILDAVLKERTIFQWIVVLVLVAGFTAAVFASGLTSARDKTNYMIFGPPINVVVLRVYDDYAVAAYVQKATNDNGYEITGEFTVIPVQDFGQAPVSTRRVGPLQNLH